MHPPPGQLIDVGGCRLHLYQQGLCQSGTGGPTVVLESGIAGSLLGWSIVQPQIAEFTRVCSYDRAGLGWSDTCPTPRTVEQMVAELATLLERARVPAPYVLVGHSFGGLLIRAYAHLHPQDVAGLVFVDPVSLDTWAGCAPANRQRLEQGIRLSRRGALLARFGLVQFALWTLASGGRLFPKLLVNTTATPGAHTIERLLGEVRRLPPEVWPMIRAHWSRSKSFRAMAAYLECLPMASQAALAMPLPANIPVTILSASTATSAELAERDRWLASNPAAQHHHIAYCGHWIQLEHPHRVVAAVRAMVDQLNQNRSSLPKHLLTT